MVHVLLLTFHNGDVNHHPSLNNDLNVSGDHPNLSIFFTSGVFVGGWCPFSPRHLRLIMLFVVMVNVSDI